MTIDLSGHNGDAPAEQHDPPEYFDETTGEVRWDGFREGRIQNFLGLDWAGQKLAEYERGLAQNDAAHKRFLEVVEQRVAERRAFLLGKAPERYAELQTPLQKQADFFRAAIESYGREFKKDVLIGRAKSRVLPTSGVVLKYRSHDAGYRYDQRPGPDGRPPMPAENKAALLAWAVVEEKESGELLTIRDPAPDLQEIKLHLVALYDPEQPRFTPPGLEYVPPGETLTVSVGEEESK